MKFRIVILILVMLRSFAGYAQTDPVATPPNVVPLAPDAAEFAKYGSIPVSLSTGVPDISIPIYEIHTGKINVPITLSYHSSGIQVTQKASWVGLGWSLNAGGVISRSVRGLPDEKTYGWMNEQNTTQTIVGSQDPVQLGQFADVASDSHPDFFSYNMPGGSGRFIYSQSTSSFQTIPSEPIKIARITAGGTNLDNTYQITGADGTNYYFQDKQSYFNDQGIGVANQYVQSWYLSKIVSADTKDTVQFNYTINVTAGGTNEQLSESEVHTYSSDNDNISSGGTNLDYTDLGSVFHLTSFYHSYIELKEIIFKQGKVVFEANNTRRDYLGYMLDGITVYAKQSDGTYTPVHKYQLNHDYFTTAQPSSDEFDYRLRLLSISKLSLGTDGTSQTHQFFYDTTPLPSTNAKAMDYWGYYNNDNVVNGSYIPHILPSHPDLSKFAQANQYIGGANRDESDALIQTGILKKIKYPTGGYSVFNYESNQYTSDQQQTSTITVTSATLQGIGKNQINTATTNITWPNNTANNTGTMVITFSPNTNPGAADVPQQVTLTDLTTNTNVGVWEHSGDNTQPYTVNAGAFFDPSHSYQLKLVVDDNAPTSVSFSLRAQQNTGGITTKKGGGLRIASIQNFDKTDALVTTQKYTYPISRIGKNDNLLANNCYKQAYRKSYPIPNSPPIAQCSFYTFYSIYYYGTSGYAGQNFEGASILYSDVIKTEYDNNNNPNGKTEYTYNIGESFSSILSPTMPGGKEYIDNNCGRSSLPLTEAYYKTNSDGSFSLIKSKSYDYGGPGFFVENLEQVTRNYIWVNAQCATQDPYVATGDQGEFAKNGYLINIEPSKLISVTEGDYSNPTNPVNTVTQYDYDNPANLQVTRVHTTDSDGSPIVTQNKYPTDYTDNTYGSDQLRSQAINNTIVEQTTTKNSSLVKKTADHFTSNQGSILPDYGLKAQTNGTMETRLKYNQYDSDGKILEVEIANGSNAGQKTAYLWGYNHTYLLAEIKNASYQDVINVLGQSTIDQLNNNTPDDNSLRSTLSALRTGLSNAFVTTYTYKPLVGMTSMTDPKEETTYYEYDGFQRLTNIRDKNNSIVKHFEYHYKQ